MKLRNYQENAINELISKSQKYLDKKIKKTIVLKSPTGSGKTIMMADFIDRLSGSRKNLAFIWLAPRDLHRQSKGKLSKYFLNRKINVYEFNELKKKFVNENEMLFINWESINKKTKNILMKDNEKNYNFEYYLNRTRENGFEIILIIDEAHFQAKTKKSEAIINEIVKPNLAIDVTATPPVISDYDIVSVEHEEVVAEGMIKKNIKFNEGFKNSLKNKKLETELSSHPNKKAIDQAIIMRNKLHDKFKNADSIVNPLILIQLPTDPDNKTLDDIEEHLSLMHNITRDNAKLAVHLSTIKDNIDHPNSIHQQKLDNNNNPVEVIITKDAAALGWDCPRAQILVLLREWKSFTFSTQTLGRVLRMPEPNIGHYDDEMLNSAYIFTNIEELSIGNDLKKTYIDIHVSRNTLPKNIGRYSLKSIYLKRQRQRDRLTPEFIKIFLEFAEKDKLYKKIDLHKDNLSLKFISDHEIDSINDLFGKPITSNFEANIKDPSYLQELYDLRLQTLLEPEFKRQDRSINRIKKSIYDFFYNYFQMPYQEGDNQAKIIKIVMNKDNYEYIKIITEKTKQHYLNILSKLTKEVIEVPDWTFPQSTNHSIDSVKMDVSKSLFQPFFYDGKYTSESKFIEYLESHKKVLLWFKNGSSDSTSFALPYKISNEIQAFYVDFIVIFENNVIGLFDPHSTHLRDFDPKVKGLADYIEKYTGLCVNQGKNKKINLIGGILTNTSKSYSGTWMVHNKNKGLIEADMALTDYINEKVK